MLAKIRRCALSAAAWIAVTACSFAIAGAAAQEPACAGRVAVTPDLVASLGFSGMLQFLVDRQWVAADTQLEMADSASRPPLVNAPQVQASLARRYPRELRDAGVGGTTIVRVLIASSGRVERALVVKGSGHDEIDTVAQESTREMRFRPWNQNACGIPIVTEVPIVMTAR